MTTGNRSLGNVSGYGCSGFGYSKIWSGSDGRQNSDGTSRWNPYTMSKVVRYQKAGRLSVGTPPYRSCLTNDICLINCGGSYPLAWTANDDLMLYAKLAEKVKAHKFNAAVFASQGNQLVDQAVSTITALARAILCLKSGNLSCALKNLGLSPGQRKKRYMRKKLNSGDVSGAWLAMQYGWLPTLSDIFAAAEAYHALTAPVRHTKFRVRVVKTADFNGSQSKSNYTCKSVVKRTKVLSYRLSEQLSQSRSLGLTDPASVLWENTPFTFVFDWFLPIGTYLEALNVIPHLEGTWMIQDIQQTSGVGPTATPGLRYNCWMGVGSDSKQEILITRTVGSTPLSVAKPQVIGLEAVRGTRIFNAIALSHQLSKSRIWKEPPHRNP